MGSAVTIKHLGLQPYELAWQSLKDFTQQRTSESNDQIWLLEHPAVFTQGQAGKPEHLLQPGTIPVIQSDRGGQVTYHGPGQLIVYVLIDLRRKNLNIRQLVTLLEQTVIEYLNGYNITASSKCAAPGVYVNDAKICSLGLRVRKGCTYHGLSLNVAMDLEPFSRINPCGVNNLQMAQLSDLGGPSDINQVSAELIEILTAKLEYIEVKHD